MFQNPVAADLFSRLYWIYRTFQYRLFYKDEGVAFDKYSIGRVDIVTRESRAKMGFVNVRTNNSQCMEILAMAKQIRRGLDDSTSLLIFYD
jgi:hypothetical protein